MVSSRDELQCVGGDGALDGLGGWYLPGASHADGDRWGKVDDVVVGFPGVKHRWWVETVRCGEVVTSRSESLRMGETRELDGSWYAPGMSQSRMGGDWRLGRCVGKVSFRNEVHGWE